MRLLLAISVALLMFASQSQSACAADALPCSCLQELWYDNPGPYDLYFSLDHYTTCNDEGEEGLWYGYASNSTLPQICGYQQCEEYEGSGRQAAATFPGHGQELVGVKAWDTYRVGLESATRKMPGLEFGTPAYHIISRKNLPAKLKAAHDMVVMAIPLNVHVKGSPFDGKTYFLCVQMDSADGLPITKAVFEDGKLGRGSQLSIKYRIKNSEVRKGLIWLK
jgi:hypothetical protein